MKKLYGELIMCIKILSEVICFLHLGPSLVSSKLYRTFEVLRFGVLTKVGIKLQEVQGE